jgi:hypothetical protein
MLITFSILQTNANYVFATADSFEQVYDAVSEVGAQHTGTCGRDLVKIYAANI